MGAVAPQNRHQTRQTYLLASQPSVKGQVVSDQAEKPDPAPAHPEPPAKRGLFKRAFGSVGTPGLWGTVPIIAICFVIGLIVGYLLGGLAPGSYSATTAVDGTPLVTLNLPADMSTDAVTRYTSTEVIYFGYQEKKMQAAIAAQTTQANPAPPTAVVETGTPLIDISAAGPTAADAAQASAIATEVYLADWRARTVAQIDRTIASINQTIAQIGPKSAAVPTMQIELAQAQLAKDQVNTVQRVVHPATPAAAVYSSSAITVAILGGLIGILIGLGILLLARRRKTEGRTEAVS